MRNQLILVAASLLALGCGLEDGQYARTRLGSSSLAITNAEGEQEVLRTGTALNVSVDEQMPLRPSTIYQVTITNLRSGSVVASADLLSNEQGVLQISTVAHDLGEFDDIQEGDSVSVRIDGPDKKGLAESILPLTPHQVHFAGHGFQVDETQPPHVYSCDHSGTPLNSFVVGALPEGQETGAPLYIAGRGFPTEVTTVDVYVVRDRDAWKGRKLPQAGQADHLFGPMPAQVDRGVLAPTALGWAPTGKDLGPYDLLVDVDRNGTFDYTFSNKDGADGEDKVGLTVQYGARWLRAKSSSVAADLSADAAVAASKAADASATKAEAAAKSGGSQAQELARHARAQATKAQSQATAASGAAKRAQAAFDQTLADDAAAVSEAAKADAAAKLAASAAESAGKLVSDTLAAAAAHRAALAAQMSAKHLLVNLAYSAAGRRDGVWSNSYTRQASVYTYVNPPVQAGERHAAVTKLLVRHQDWSKFWNNPDKLIQGRILIKDLVVQTTTHVPQRSCTNSPPIIIITPNDIPLEMGETAKFDVVFDYGNDGYYDIGKDLLDVVGHSESADLISPKDLSSLPDSRIFGFQVTR